MKAALSMEELDLCKLLEVNDSATNMVHACLLYTSLLMWSNYSDRAVDLGTIAAYDISPVMMELFGLRQPAYFQFLGRQLRAAYRANTCLLYTSRCV